MSEREPVTYWARLVKVYRERRHWTQAQLADVLEVEVRSIKHWEAGTRIPSRRIQRLVEGGEEKAA